MVMGTGLSQKCVKCGGVLVLSYGEVSCMNCGATPMTVEERRTWWRDNKKDIAKDVRELGAAAAITKWRIPKQLVGHLYRGQGAQLPKPSANAIAVQMVKQLPNLPEFKDTWGPDVQKKWFDIWFYLVTK